MYRFDTTDKEISRLGDSISFELKDVINLEFLQRFLDAFGGAVGVAGLGTDKDGTPITNPTNFTDFCMNLNRGCEKGLARCKKSDAFGGVESARTGKPAVYFCENGLMDFGAPIIVNGQQMGSILGGQVLTDQPDPDKFIQIAKSIGVNPDDYLNALSKVPILPESQIKAAADLLYIVATEISNMGYEKLLLSKMFHSLSDHIQEAMATLEELTASASDVTENQIRLTSEIQKLSEKSNETVTKVKAFTSQIKNSVDQTNAMGNATLNVTKEQELAIRRIAEMLGAITDMTQDLSQILK